MRPSRAAPLPSSAGHEPIDWTGVETRRVEYPETTLIFSQGDPCTSVLYIDRGAVRLSILSRGGREAIVADLEPGSFFGEGCLAGQPVRIATATAVTSCIVVHIEKRELTRQMLDRPILAQRFLTHMLTRNVRIEEDLIDQLLNDAEKRLARTLLLLARYGGEDASHRTLPKVTQSVLAEMVGTTRSRVSVFMNKFRRLGFIEYNGTLKVNSSLLTVLLRDVATARPEARNSQAGATRERASKPRPHD